MPADAECCARGCWRLTAATTEFRITCPLGGDAGDISKGAIVFVLEASAGCVAEIEIDNVNLGSPLFGSPGSHADVPR